MLRKATILKYIYNLFTLKIWKKKLNFFYIKTRPTDNNNSFSPNHGLKCLNSVIITSVHIMIQVCAVWLRPTSLLLGLLVRLHTSGFIFDPDFIASALWSTLFGRIFFVMVAKILYLNILFVDWLLSAYTWLYLDNLGSI